MKNLIYYADLAHRVLEGNSQYSKDKQIIRHIFDSTDIEYEDKMRLRLTVIDSYYSTQMNKRLSGIDDIVTAMMHISDNDSELRRRFIDFIINPDSKIDDLFTGKYGFSKKGEQGKQAPSIISKYAYFLTNYKFPIYDTFAAKTYRKVRRCYPNLKLDPLSQIFDTHYFNKLATLNSRSGIANIEKLDNLLWLHGKVYSGSYSLILDRSRHERLNRWVGINEDLVSKDIDQRIKERIIEGINDREITSILLPELIEFIKFCFRME